MTRYITWPTTEFKIIFNSPSHAISAHNPAAFFGLSHVVRLQLLVFWVYCIFEYTFMIIETHCNLYNNIMYVSYMYGYYNVLLYVLYIFNATIVVAVDTISGRVYVWNFITIFKWLQCVWGRLCNNIPILPERIII